ncbi:hypothetical protein Patl1_24768 [Pistacia atlantica]|uniref:Uncharacterized protein n=1 Tax=Pistacia atlantica TaxID=434234 RepID=A0ACC1B2L8_9ROSI|nr:hypothetical protein Patl1_24768 [Pistacia atlantica]
MGSLVGEKDGIIRSVSDTPPTHYAVVIQLFSLLSETAEKYESAEFEAGGYKWKLVLHPNGNKSKNVEDHISLYLAMADVTSLPPGWELVDDTCELGAEVFVRKERSTGKGECLKMIKDPSGFNHLWKIENLEKLDSDYYDSREFTAAGYKWKMQLYPKGRDSGTGSHLSLYLVLADLASLTPPPKIYVDYSLRIAGSVPQVGKVVL